MTLCLGKGVVEMTISEFKQKQSLPYEAKIAHAEKRAWEFYDTITGLSLIHI